MAHAQGKPVRKCPVFGSGEQVKATRSASRKASFAIILFPFD